MTATTVQPGKVAEGGAVRRLRGWWTNPWGQTRYLWVFAWLFAIWSIAPVALAILFSFNAGRSRSNWQGFSTRWYWSDPRSVVNDESLLAALGQSLRLAALTMLIATPIGVALAIGLARWRGRGAKPAGFLMALPLVTPEIVMGVSLFLVFGYLYDFVPFGTPAQALGHITFTISFIVIIVRGRLFAIGRDYEEAAMDLGASQWQAIRRVLLPMLSPAIFASLAIAFALSIDDFVISMFLTSDASSITVPVKLYSAIRNAPPPSLNALATIMLVVTLVAVTIATIVMKRGKKKTGESGSAMETLVQMEI
jgi:spermidine/putrescine transport system permease protein